MSIYRTLVAFAICGALLSIPSSLRAQAGAQGPLARAKRVKCTFTLMAVGTWGKEKVEAQVKPVTGSQQYVEFEGINTDEGTAEQKSPYGGKYDIIVRYANGYLHLIQSFLDGPLYTTTILEKKTADGKYKGMQSRHEHTDVSLPTFTSSPEQYYGTCEILN